MDPITGAIVAALAAGVAGGAAEVGKKVIVDAYDALKTALKNKFGAESKVAQAVADLEAEPDFEPNQGALAGRVAQAKAAEDAELRELAQALLDALESTPEGKQAVGKYQIDARGAQVGVIGDDARVEGGLHFHQGPTTGDTFNMSGDFRGANVNIKSTLTNVTQTIGALPDADPSTKAELEALIQQLNDALQQVPGEKAEEAEAVAQSAELLVKTATEEKPNKTMVQISGEGLKQAAKNIADVMPTVLTIATQIVATIAKFVA
jgi:hypothetical protein